MSLTPDREEVERFLASTKFSGYQAVPLPHGLQVPGKDMEARADYILGDRVQGRTMLEVGTYYGGFPEAALRRGATGAAGLEPDPERGAIAAEIARLNGERCEIIRGGLDDLPTERQFDVVLFLRVLHHVLDPIAVMQQLAAHTRELLIVEFSLTSDIQYLRPSRRLGARTFGQQMRSRLTSWALRRFAGHLPLLAVGGEAYHRTWYLNPSAFENLFVTHHRLFSEVSFLPSSSDRAHAVALCRPRHDAGA